MRKALKVRRGIERQKQNLQDAIESGLKAQKQDQRIRHERALRKAAQEAENAAAAQIIKEAQSVNA